MGHSNALTWFNSQSRNFTCYYKGFSSSFFVTQISFLSTVRGRPLLLIISWNDYRRLHLLPVSVSNDMVVWRCWRTLRALNKNFFPIPMFNIVYSNVNNIRWIRDSILAVLALIFLEFNIRPWKFRSFGKKIILLYHTDLTVLAVQKTWHVNLLSSLSSRTFAKFVHPLSFKIESKKEHQRSNTTWKPIAESRVLVECSYI